MRCVVQPMRSRFNRSRRGITLVETVLATGVTLMVFATLSFFSTFQAKSWQEAAAVVRSQRMGQSTLERLAPSIRAARGVVVASSSATKLTLQMPLYDGSGNLAVPVSNGDLLSFYLSDSTGNPNNTGGILWRSKNGTPDGTWSLPGTNGRTVLGNSALTFSYYPAANPETVTITVNTLKTIGNKTVVFPTSMEVLLRNKGL